MRLGEMPVRGLKMRDRVEQDRTQLRANRVQTMHRRVHDGKGHPRHGRYIQSHRLPHDHRDQPARRYNNRAAALGADLVQHIADTGFELLEGLGWVFQRAIGPGGEGFWQVLDKPLTISWDGDPVLLLKQLGEGEIFDLIQAWIADWVGQTHGSGRLHMPGQSAAIDARVMGAGVAQMRPQPARLLVTQLAEPVIACLVPRGRVGLPVTHQCDMRHVGPS